jgi:hypothetical protein
VRSFFPFFQRMSPNQPVRTRRRWLPNWVKTTASILALAALSYVLGAAVMFFGLPSADFLGRAFVGAETWFMSANAPTESESAGKVTVDSAGSTFDGFTLWTTCYEPSATLIDMRGRTVHQWKISSRRTWVGAAGVRGPLPGEPVHWQRCRLFPNGDLLALCCKADATPYGFGLVKVDKDSNVLWEYAGHVHHDVEIGEDGRIYALTFEPNAKAPPNLETEVASYTAEYLVVLSKDGVELERIPLMETFRNSPYSLALLRGSRFGPRLPFMPDQMVPSKLPQGQLSRSPRMPNSLPVDPSNVIHSNSVQVLSRALAPKFPMFKEGQVLLSLRASSVLAVLDVPSRAVVWAASGIWHNQHAASFLDNGNLLLFDNAGLQWGARVLEYSPGTQAYPWSYAATKDKPLHSPQRGAAQRLPNGNTLILESEALRILEVTKSQQVVWEWRFPAPPDQPLQGGDPNISCAQRFGPDELPFLQGSSHVPAR